MAESSGQLTQESLDEKQEEKIHMHILRAPQTNFQQGILGNFQE